MFLITIFIKFRCGGKITRVLEVYEQLQVREACRAMMDEHYTIAMHHLKALNVMRIEKQPTQFAELLMVRVN